MRQIKLTLKSGGDAGTITEKDDGTLSAEGRAQNLLKLAPSTTFDYWVDQLPHSHYLDFAVES